MSKQLAIVSLTVEMESIRTYAELTDDFNPIHLDPAFAATTPMGDVIAHGTMSVCLLWQAIFRNFDAAAVATAELDVKFVKPVRIGDVLQAGGEADAENPLLYAVWVRAGDGADRLAGTLRFAVPVILKVAA